MMVVGLYYVIKVHKFIASVKPSRVIHYFKELFEIALPAVLTNIATPVGNGFVTAAISDYGDSAVAGWAVIGRLIPVAFGAVFALSGAVAPIIGQNYGAKRFDRLIVTIQDSLKLIIGYCLFIWLLAAVSRHFIVDAFSLSGEGADIVLAFCAFYIVLFSFNGALFVANSAFNNLGYATYSTVTNWGRATLGTIPFVMIGSHYMGAEGVIFGQLAGGIFFGIGAIYLALRTVYRIAEGEVGNDDAVLPPELPAFANPTGFSQISDDTGQKK